MEPLSLGVVAEVLRALAALLSRPYHLTGPRARRIKCSGFARPAKILVLNNSNRGYAFVHAGNVETLAVSIDGDPTKSALTNRAQIAELHYIVGVLRVSLLNVKLERAHICPPLRRMPECSEWNHALVATWNAQCFEIRAIAFDTRLHELFGNR